jgi:hypothetical protein
MSASCRTLQPPPSLTLPAMADVDGRGAWWRVEPQRDLDGRLLPAWREQQRRPWRRKRSSTGGGRAGATRIACVVPSSPRRTVRHSPRHDKASACVTRPPPPPLSTRMAHAEAGRAVVAISDHPSPLWSACGGGAGASRSCTDVAAAARRPR